MAIVRVYFHRTPARVGPHLRYIATRDGACGLQGLGRDFRALRGDIDACTRLMLEHAEQARRRTGGTTREGAFLRLLFTLPPDAAMRVAEADARLPEGSRLVLRDALEATFRSAGRSLQGVYAIHFHAARREAHGHVHVDLSPLDIHGRPTFVSEDQRATFRAAWTREVARALDRVERRAPGAQREVTAATVAPRSQPMRGASPGTSADRLGGPEQQARTAQARTPDVFDNPHAWFVRGHTRVTRRTPSYMRFLAGRLLAATRNSQAPLLDFFLRAFVTRANERWGRQRTPLGVRFALGFPVPHVLIHARTPVTTRTLRLPFTS